MRALLVGLGRIGWQGFEAYRSVPTHGSTLMNMRGPGIYLNAAVDTDAAARSAFQQATGCLVYDNLAKALDSELPEIVIVATPVETHRDIVLEAAAHLSVRGILCEKPMAPSVAECAEMIRACRDKTLLIGHQRRYDRNHLLAAHFIKSGAIGAPIAGKALFKESGSFLNNGSHAADTLRMLIGDSVPLSMRSSPDADTFSIKCICENGSLTLDSYGKLHVGYMQTMYADLLECIDSGKVPDCSGADGMEAVRLALAAAELEDAA